jgi:hypothetical protein
LKGVEAEVQKKWFEEKVFESDAPAPGSEAAK